MPNLNMHLCKMKNKSKFYNGANRDSVRFFPAVIDSTTLCNTFHNVVGSNNTHIIWFIVRLSCVVITHVFFHTYRIRLHNVVQSIPTLKEKRAGNPQLISCHEPKRDSIKLVLLYISPPLFYTEFATEAVDQKDVVRGHYNRTL